MQCFCSTTNGNSPAVPILGWDFISFWAWPVGKIHGACAQVNPLSQHRRDNFKSLATGETFDSNPQILTGSRLGVTQSTALEKRRRTRRSPDAPRNDEPRGSREAVGAVALAPLSGAQRRYKFQAGGFQNVFTLALIPAFSPGEKENRSPGSGNIGRRRWREAHREIKDGQGRFPLLWGEGQGEGGRKN
jgi:hypothetical protein